MASDDEAISLDNFINILNPTLSLDNSLTISDHLESSTTTSESGILCSASTTPSSFSNHKDFIFPEKLSASALFERVIERCKPFLMKVHGSADVKKSTEELCLNDQEVEIQWQKTLDFYKNQRQCTDYGRIENEIYQCFNALFNDRREIMIGLDSISSLEHLLITSMKICSEPNFKLEIRIGFGGTSDRLTLRTPSYAVAGINLLHQLIELREKFLSNQSVSGSIPTTIFNTPPILTFFCAWTAAVKVNNLDAIIGKEHADDMLSYIKMYINHYHSNLSGYVRYEMDHENTYEDRLLNRIMTHFIHDFKDVEMKRSLINQAISHGSDEYGSIKYASMHLIIFKDIIDQDSPHSIFHSLDENENIIQTDELVCVYDCIITIGGPVEERFNKVRDSVRQAFINESDTNIEENFHFPLSIRMLSKAGQIPVYYHDQHEITVDQVLKGHITDLNLTDRKYRYIKEDISILREDIGVSILKSIWSHIPPNLKPDNTSSWKQIILTLTGLCIKAWQAHANTNNRKCRCVTKNQKAIDQVCEHYQLSNDLNDKERLIINCILHTLEEKIGSPFGTIKARRPVYSISANTDTMIAITNELDHVLSEILIYFITLEFS